MKNELLQIRTDKEFKDKLCYLMKVYDSSTMSDVIRKIIDIEYEEHKNKYIHVENLDELPKDKGDLEVIDYNDGRYLYHKIHWDEKRNSWSKTIKDIDLYGYRILY